MNLYKIQKDEQQQRVNDFLRRFAFFAFNENQFKEGLQKLNIPQGEEKVLVQFFSGGYMLKEREPEFKQLLRELREDRATAISDPDTGAQFALDMFLEELANHEFTFTGDEWETLDALGISPEALAESETLQTALTKAKETLLKEDAELDILDELKNIEDEIYFEMAMECDPGGEDAEKAVEAMARRIKEDGLADKITSGILEKLTARNFHLVKRAAEMVREPTA